MPITPHKISGPRHQIGEALGELARPYLGEHLAQSPTWAALRPWRGHAFLAYIEAQIRQSMPELAAELEGMAHALEMPLHDLLLWNCRGDFLPKLDLPPEPAMDADASTSIAASTGNTRWLAHQQTLDMPEAHCYLVEVNITSEPDSPGFISHYQPGTLPGCGFSANRLGITQITDNLWPSGDVSIDPGLPRIPRIVLSRAILDCRTMDQVLHLLGSTSCLGGLHLLLCSAQDHLLWSVETVPGVASYEELGRYYPHTNHMRHTDTAQRPQYIPTGSQQRCKQIERNPEITPDTLLRALNTSRPRMSQRPLSTVIFEIEPGIVKLHLHDSIHAVRTIEI